MHRVRFTVTTLLTATLAACGSSGSDAGPMGPSAQRVASPHTVSVTATDQMTFSPAKVTVAPGGTVVFEFGGLGHTVLFDSGANPPDNIPDVTVNTSVTRTMTTPGTYTYHCRIHPGMSGTIVVADYMAPSSVTPPATPPATPPGEYP
jgi:plastocyanin